MKTQLDEKQELINKIKVLSASDIQKLKVFIAGVEAGKEIKESGDHGTAWNERPEQATNRR